MLKSWVESFLIALSMYSTIPVKCLHWTEKNLRNAMIFFPFIGLLCGTGVWCVWVICKLLSVGSILFAVLAVLSTVCITGGIHLDGFCDTADALYSRRPKEEKLRILKDPNCGPFAVFSVILVLLVQIASYTELYQNHEKRILWLISIGFLLSRCLSAISVTAYPAAPTSSLAKTFGEHAGKHVTIILMIFFSIFGLLSIWQYRCLAFILLTISSIVFWRYSSMQKKKFGGMTGDLAGFFLVLYETVWLLMTALLGGVLLSY